MALAANIAQALLAAERPLIVSGTGCGSVAVLQAASNIVGALARLNRKPSISLVFAEANSVGEGLMAGLPLEAALKKMESGAVETLIVSENDLYRRVSEQRLDAALARVRNIVVLDCIATRTLARASAVLPAGSFAEADGTLVNNEGRAQRYFQVFPAEGIRESWRWLQQVAAAAGVAGLGDSLDALTAACAKLAGLHGIEHAAPNAKFRISGARVPRQPHRYSGRTAMNAKKDVHEPQPAQDSDSPLAFSMEGATGLAPEPAALIPMVWYPSWNSPQAVNKFQAEIGGHVKGGDAGVLLFKPDAAARPAWFNPPAASSGLEVVPLHALFGSEELSALAPAMATRIPAAFVAVNPATAAQHKLKDGETTSVKLNGSTASLPVSVRADLAPGCVGVTVGLKGVPAVTPGATAGFGGKA